MKFIKYLLTIIILSSFTSKENNYVNYFEITNKAELAIVDSSYNSALDLYKKAFNLDIPPLTRDLKNAMYCAYFNHDTVTTVNIVEKLLKKGMPINDIEEDKYLVNILRNTNYLELKKTYPEIEKYCRTKYNYELHEEGRKIYLKDQYYDKKRFEEEYVDSNYIVVYKNAERLIEIFNQYGYPNENVVGVQSRDYFSIPTIHFFQCKKKLELDMFSKSKSNLLKLGICFDSLRFEQALEKGKLKSGAFNSSIVNKTDEIDPYGCIILLVVDRNYELINRSKEQISCIDSLRKSANLCSYNDYIKKAKFELFNKYDFRKWGVNETKEDYTKNILNSVNNPKVPFDLGTFGSNKMNFFVDTTQGNLFFEKQIEAYKKLAQLPTCC